MYAAQQVKVVLLVNVCRILTTQVECIKLLLCDITLLGVLYIVYVNIYPQLLTGFVANTYKLALSLELESVY